MIKVLAAPRSALILRPPQSMRLLGGRAEEWVRFVAAHLDLHRHVGKRIGRAYDASDLDDALDDEAIRNALREASHALGVLRARHPRATAVTLPIWLAWRLSFPAAVRRNRVAPSVRRALEAIVEAAKAESPSLPTVPDTGDEVRDRSLRLVLTDKSDLFAAAYDTIIPTEIARGVHGALMARLALEFARAAQVRGVWTDTDFIRIYSDWADWTETALGVFAGVTGMHIRSLPRERVVDFEGIVARHKARRARFAAEAEAAQQELTKS